MIRLERIEKRNRRLSWVVAAIAVLGISGFVMRATRLSSQVVVADDFILRDANGEKRAWLSTFGDYPALIFYDENDKSQVILGVAEYGPSLVLYDQKGTARASLNLRADRGEPALVLNDENKITRLGLGMGVDGPLISLWDANEKLRVWLIVTEEGPALDFIEADGETSLYSIP